MIESPVYELIRSEGKVEGKEEGREEGLEEGAAAFRGTICDLALDLFDEPLPTSMLKQLEKITDLDVLRSLIRRLAKCASLKEFQRLLSEM